MTGPVRLLLPPSETKQQSGTGPVVDLAALHAPTLLAARRELVSRLLTLCADETEARKVLKLGERLWGEVAVNRAVLSSPTLPALLRYTGVLYDALQAGSLSPQRWATAGDRVIVQSALFGPVRADDAIPAYRLSATTARPLGPLKRYWSAATNGIWDDESFIVDARSEAYRALSPVPEHVPQLYVRVLAGDGSGAALNHFNKAAKGRLASALIAATELPSTPAELVEWGEANALSLSLDAAAPGEVVLYDWGAAH